MTNVTSIKKETVTNRSWAQWANGLASGHESCIAEAVSAMNQSTVGRMTGLECTTGK